MNERWRDINGYIGLYQVSDQGRVRSLWRNDGRIMRPAKRGHGYMGLVLYGGKKTPRSFYVHRLVLEAFAGPAPTSTHQAGHRNGQPNDNRLANLRWVSPSENAADKKLHGTIPRGESASWSKLTADDVRHIRKSAKTSAELAREYGVSPGAVSMARTGKTWRHLDMHATGASQ